MCCHAGSNEHTDLAAITEYNVQVSHALLMLCSSAHAPLLHMSTIVHLTC